MHGNVLFVLRDSLARQGLEDGRNHHSYVLKVSSVLIVTIITIMTIITIIVVAVTVSFNYTFK